MSKHYTELRADLERINRAFNDAIAAQDAAKANAEDAIFQRLAAAVAEVSQADRARLLAFLYWDCEPLVRAPAIAGAAGLDLYRLRLAVAPFGPKSPCRRCGVMTERAGSRSERKSGGRALCAKCSDEARRRLDAEQAAYAKQSEERDALHENARAEALERSGGKCEGCGDDRCIEVIGPAGRFATWTISDPRQLTVWCPTCIEVSGMEAEGQDA